MTERARTKPKSQASLNQRVADNALVFAGFATKSGEPSILRFGQDVWHVNEVILAPNQHDVPYRIDFARVGSASIQVALKEFSHARVRVAAGGYRASKPATMHSNTTGLIRIFEALYEAEGIASLREVTQEMFDRWLARAKVEGVPVEAHVYQLKVLYAYRGHISEPLQFNPWRGRSGFRVTGVQHGAKNPENTTPRIPEALAGPLLQWAFRYIDEFSVEIIQALEVQLNKRPAATGINAPCVEQRLEQYLTHLRATGGGLPSLSPALPTDDQFEALVNDRKKKAATGWVTRTRAWASETMSDAQILLAVTHLKKKVLGESETDAAHIRGLLLQAADEIGLDWQCAAELPTETLVMLRRGSIIGKVLVREMTMLVLAGFIVVAYLTGMRDSEVQDMRRGCLRRHRSNDGSPTRWYIRSRVWKARNVMGDPEQWVAIAEVAKTVQVIERLHEVMGSPADCYLFGLRLSDSFKQRRADLPIGQRIGRLLDLFRNHVNALAKRSTMTKPIPEWEGQVWTFSSRQFRRTLAWHVVNRPFGTVAGMRHFKHLGIQIMEGYGGMSASGFAGELDEERMLGTLDSLVDRYDDWHRGVKLAGPGAVVLEREFESIQASIGGGPMIADGARLRAMLKHRAKHLYPGLLSDCSFDPNYAQCGGTTAPRREACRPNSCANSYITSEHKVRWLKHAGELDQYLVHRKELPSGQIERLVQAREEVAQVLAQGTQQKERSN
jgi:hypothetical protein